MSRFSFAVFCFLVPKARAKPISRLLQKYDEYFMLFVFVFIFLKVNSRSLIVVAYVKASLTMIPLLLLESEKKGKESWAVCENWVRR
jgi:hypothetical protein